MTRRLAPLVLLVLLVLALAGCIGGAPADTQAPGDDSPEVIEDPDNYTYVDNASFATGGHVHDYWDGQEQVTVLDKTIDEGSTWMGPPIPTATFLSDKGKTVPQGTETVDVTVDWTEDPYSTYDRVELWVQTAGENESQSYGEIERGDTVTIESTNGDNDLPHRQLSAWKFHFVVVPVNMETPAGNVSFLEWQGEVSMEVVAHRGLELPVFPAHPDVWGNRTEIDLMEAEQYVRYRGDPADGWSCFGGCPTVHSPDNGTIVPFDTEVVEFRLAYKPTTPGTDMELKYHAADTWGYTELEPDDVADDGTKVYRVPVDLTMGDGPYSDQSLWQFAPYPSEPRPYDWVDGTYTLSATAFKEMPS